MKKLLISALLCIGYTTHAQEFKCQLPILPSTELFIPIDPERHITLDETEEYIIPVVVHILHMDGPENISDAQVHSMIQALNEDYNKSNPDIGDVIPEYSSVVADVGITFKLAKKDPSGNPTSGITRTFSDKTLNGYEYTSSMLSPWPREKYLNIWIVKSMGVEHDDNVAAYAMYPSSVHHYPEYDGIVSRYNYAGFIGEASEATRHVVTHEAGHYFSLMHPWGDSPLDAMECGDDNIADIPPTGPSGCELSRSICTPGVIENVQNFMTGSYCFRMFTEGQKEKILSTLNNDISQRNNLWTDDNLIATGLKEPVGINQIKHPNAQIYPNPFNDIIHIRQISSDIEIQISNVFGQNVFSKKYTMNDHHQINLTSFVPGVYWLTIVDKEGIVMHAQKIIKK